MKQIFQDLRSGTIEVAEVPCPQADSGQLLIRTSRSLISAGTERMLLDFGKANPIEKARQQPEKVRMVLDKIKTDGLMPTLDAVRNKLEQPLPLGYCNVGEVVEVGKGVEGFAVGDKVVSNGKHAEMVLVPVNLCARIPPLVGIEAAAFTVVGAIALQGIRLVQPTLGEAVVVAGLGLIGQLAVQLLRANGCRVLGIDFEPDRLALAKSMGAEVVNLGADEDPVQMAEAFSRGRGVDAVLVTATTRSSEPIHQAALMCRQRGRIVLVGVTGLELSRDDFYNKELTFQVSCSYGPGRYEVDYEEKGQDYPVGYVRWTEQRNFEAVLDMLATGGLDVNPLVSHRFVLENAEAAYAVVGGSEPSLGILLEYPTAVDKPDASLLQTTVPLVGEKALVSSEGEPSVAFIGAGNYATAVLIPAFKAARARLYSVASSAGISGGHAGRKYGFEKNTTETDRLFADPQVDAVVISTRHNSHAKFVLQGLEMGKHVFVEKPLCLTLEELEAIVRTYTEGSCNKTRSDVAGHEGLQTSNTSSDSNRQMRPLLMVGFNRRFAKQVQKIKELLATAGGPKAFVMTINAGAIPHGHWTQDREVGGGRIIGEVCHFIDLLRFLADSQIISYANLTMKSKNNDTASLQLGFADGSIGTVHYFANGNKSFPKERLEIFTEGRILQLDNYRKLTGYGWPGFRRMNLWRQDKGQRAGVAAFLRVIKSGGPAPIAPDEIFEVARVTIQIAHEIAHEK